MDWFILGKRVIGFMIKPASEISRKLIVFRNGNGHGDMHDCGSFIERYVRHTKRSRLRVSRVHCTYCYTQVFSVLPFACDQWGFWHETVYTSVPRRHVRAVLFARPGTLVFASAGPSSARGFFNKVYISMSFMAGNSDI